MNKNNDVSTRWKSRICRGVSSFKNAVNTPKEPRPIKLEKMTKKFQMVLKNASTFKVSV